MKNIVIIGAGIGGLTAANLLAKEGHRVTLFELHATPGGYTAGFRRNGFYFESGTLAFESSNLIFQTLKEIGVYDKVRFERHSFRFLSKEMDATPSTYEEFKEMFHKAYPAERASLDRYFSAVDAMYYPTVGVMGGGSMVKRLLALPVFMLQVMKYRGQTITGFTNRYFPKDSSLYRTFTTMGYPDMPAFFAGAMMHSLFNDYWTVKEGFQALADAMAGRFKEQGGELKLASPVEKILTKDGAAAGVRSRGQDYPADAVISACDYKETFLKLLEPADMTSDFRGKVEKAQVSEGMVAVYLGLALSKDALQAKLKKPSILCGAVDPGIDIYNANDETFFERTPFSLHALSLHDASLAPAGRSSVMLEAGVPYHWMDNWGGGDRQKYLALKEKVLATLIDRADALLPGLKEAVELKDLATPLTFQRYTRNTDGATSAWSWNPNKKFYRDMNIHVDTPVKNLYIGSCWSSQIGGVPGAVGAGKRCAKRIGQACCRH
jgi:phytoene dehydrogenase-like protein